MYFTHVYDQYLKERESNKTTTQACYYYYWYYKYNNVVTAQLISILLHIAYSQSIKKNSVHLF